MRIKIIPETEAEKAQMKKTEHVNVREFFIFGNRTDNDGDLIDFHDWKAQHRYLLGSLKYFYEVINDERRAVEGKKSSRQEIDLTPSSPSAAKPVPSAASPFPGAPKVVDFPPSSNAKDAIPHKAMMQEVQDVEVKTVVDSDTVIEDGHEDQDIEDDKEEAAVEKTSPGAEDE